MIDLLAKCPRCGYRLAKIDGFRVATYQVRRTCRSCYSVWRILVSPLPTRHAGAGIAMHELSFVELGRRPASLRGPWQQSLEAKS